MDSSQPRKQIQNHEQELRDVLRLLKQRRPLVRGHVYALRRKCGKATSRCQEGHLHEGWVLSVPEEGRKRMRVVPKGRRVKWQELSDRYRRFRRARAGQRKL